MKELNINILNDRLQAYNKFENKIYLNNLYD